MGIPDFFRFLSPRFAEATMPFNAARRTPIVHPVDGLYFDVNNLLYGIARRANDYDHFFVLLFQQLDTMLREFPPRKHVFLALDGPGPRAKILTQRDRRMKSLLKESNSSRRKSVVNTLQFTPGTPLMAKLKEALCYYVTARASRTIYKVGGNMMMMMMMQLMTMRRCWRVDLFRFLHL
jgi:5'-3' exoribonuclease 2